MASGIFPGAARKQTSRGVRDSTAHSAPSPPRIHEGCVTVGKTWLPQPGRPAQPAYPAVTKPAAMRGKCALCAEVRRGAQGCMNTGLGHATCR